MPHFEAKADVSAYLAKSGLPYTVRFMTHQLSTCQRCRNCAAEILRLVVAFRLASCVFPIRAYLGPHIDHALADPFVKPELVPQPSL